MISIHLAKCFQLKTEQKFTAELLPAPSFCPNYISPGWERVQILPLPKRIQRVSSLLPNLSAPVGDIQHNMELGWSLRHGASFPHHGWLSRETRQDSCIWWPSSKVSILQEKKKKLQSTHRNCSNHWPVHQMARDPCVLLPRKLQLQVKTEYFVLISFDPSKSFLMWKPS